MTAFNAVAQRLGRRVRTAFQRAGETDPHRLALTFAAGTAIGLMPAPWGTTLLCIVVAYLLGLSQIGIQVFNYLVYPVQLLLLPLFILSGDRLFSATPLGYSLVELKQLIQQSPSELFALVGTSFAYGLLLWLLLLPALALLLYFLAHRLSGRLLPASSSVESEHQAS